MYLLEKLSINCPQNAIHKKSWRWSRCSCQMILDHQVIYDYIITDYNYDYNDLAGSHGGYGHKKKKKKKKTRKKESEFCRICDLSPFSLRYYYWFIYHIFQGGWALWQQQHWHLCLLHPRHPHDQHQLHLHVHRHDRHHDLWRRLWEQHQHCQQQREQQQQQ